MNDTAPTSAASAPAVPMGETTDTATTEAASAVFAVLGAVYAYVLCYLGYAYVYFYGYPDAGGL